MKNSMKFAGRLLMVLTFAASLLSAAAVQPTEPPPRGHAYGYWMKEGGGRVMFFYVDADGSRTITLLECKPEARYRVLSTVDMKHWRTLATLNIGPDGTATCTDVTPEPHAFYRVIPLGAQR